MTCRVQAGDSLTVTLTLINCASGNPLDVAGALTKLIILKGPSSRLSKSASYTTDGSDGKLYATLSADEIVPNGEWQVQAEVTFAGSVKYHSEVKKFIVNANI